MTVVHRTVMLQFVFCFAAVFGYRSSDDSINWKATRGSSYDQQDADEKFNLTFRSCRDTDAI